MTQSWLGMIAFAFIFAVAGQPNRSTAADSLLISTFSSDITIPLGHRCMGVLKTKANQIEDPLEAHGFVIQGAGPALVLVALDWCEVRNGAYDQWRSALARAVDTTRDRVMVCSLHQHDAPVVDTGAQTYLDAQGLRGELFDRDFHNRCIEETARAARHSLNTARPLTHLRFGQARVDRIASNRRVVYRDGRVGFDRYSRTKRDSPQANLDEGEIDPFVKTLLFMNESEPVLALSAYATHPMSHYGNGAVSGDFVALARRRRQLETPDTRQIYVTGCSGDVTAGKFNDGSPAMRGVLADRLYDAMKRATDNAVNANAPTELSKDSVEFRCETLTLPFHGGEAFQREQMRGVLEDPNRSTEDRILAAMGLSSLDRVESGQQIDLPCFDLSGSQIVLLPGEAFVRYQLMAQSLAKPNPLVAIGYGECWTGYIPSDDAFREGFDHGWRWVGPGCESIIRDKLNHILRGERKAK